MAPEIEDLKRRIAEANRSWSQRVRNGMTDIQYDHAADMLYVSYDGPGEAFSFPVGSSDEGAYLRIDPETYAIKGFEVLGFKHGFLPAHPDALGAFEPIFALFGETDWRVQIGPPNEDPSRVTVLHKPAASASVDYFSDYLQKAAPELLSA